MGGGREGEGDGARNSAGNSAWDDKIVAQSNRPIQAKSGRMRDWTLAKRTAFLTELASSCNVRRATAAVGMAPTTAYKLRDREPAFARAWQAALLIGYERLEAALLARALEAVGEIDFEALDERVALVEKMTVDQAIRILAQHRESVRLGQARGRRSSARHVATQEETDAALIKRIRIAERHRIARGQPSLLSDGRSPGGGAEPGDA